MLYEIREFPHPSSFDLLLRFFPLTEQFAIEIVVKNKFKAETVEVYKYRFDVEVVEIDT